MERNRFSETYVLNQSYATTRNLVRKQPMVKCEKEDKFKTRLFLPVEDGREGEGGLRTRGYYKTPLPDIPIVTIVTVVFNGEEHLEETIESVISQTYENLEYIIIDGGSTDRTLEIIRKYDHVIDYWVSEKDKGISDAFNKAIVTSLGDYVNFQGDGDGFYSPSAVKKSLELVNPENDMLISGRIERVNKEGKTLYFSRQRKSFHKRSLLFQMSLPHQGLFANIRMFKKYGLFDISNTYCMDYEHLLRSYKEFPSVILRDIVVARWRADGVGNGRTLAIYKEYDYIKKKNNVCNPIFLMYINFWILFKYKIKEILNV